MEAVQSSRFLHRILYFERQAINGTHNFLTRLMCDLAIELNIAKNIDFLDILHGPQCIACRQSTIGYLVRLMSKYDFDDDNDEDPLRDRIMHWLTLYTSNKAKENREIKVAGHTFCMREREFDEAMFGCKTWSCSVLFVLVLVRGLYSLSTISQNHRLLLSESTEGLMFEWDMTIIHQDPSFSMDDVHWRDLVDNKTVLEMGAGTGLSGIALYRLLSPSLLVQTDYLDSILDNLLRNCQINHVDTEKNHKVAFLDWQHPERLDKYHSTTEECTEQLPSEYDCIIATDICYDVSAASLAVNTIMHRLKPQGKAIILLPKRRTFEKELAAFDHEIDQRKDNNSLCLLFKCIIHTNDDEPQYTNIYDRSLEEEFVLYLLTKP